MRDKDAEIAGLIVGAIKAGYKITLEAPLTGAAKQGTHMHVGYLDEVVEELKDINPWDYINAALEES